MDPQALIAGTQQLAKAGAALGAAVPFTALVKRFLGPATDEIAERIKDEVRLYRYGRQLSLLHKAEAMAKEAGFTPNAVPIKPLFSLLEGASLEEDDDLHDKWAALLANAANPATPTLVRPSFMDTLKLMTSDVARFLDAAYSLALEGSGSVAGDSVARKLTRVDLGTYDALFTVFGEAGCTLLHSGAFVTSTSSTDELDKDEADRQHFALVMDELTRFGMWSLTTGRGSGTHTSTCLRMPCSSCRRRTHRQREASRSNASRVLPNRGCILKRLR